MTVTWDHIHLGDVVRGADQRPWEVVGRQPGTPWIGGGREDRYRLRNGNREVVTTQKVIEPVDLIRKAADAELVFRTVQVLVDSLGPLESLGEGRMQPELMTPPAPKKQIKRDRYKRYLLPDPETGEEKAWTRVSTVARTLADGFGLAQYDMRMVAKGMGLRPDLVAGAGACDLNQDKGALQSIAEQAKDAAGARSGSNFGTAFHNYTRRLDAGEPLAALQAQPPLDADLQAYATLMAQQRLRVVHAERVVVIPELGVAGQFDRLVAQPPGQTHAAPHAIVDLKSAKSLDFSWLEIAIQEALYAHATYIWNQDTETYERMPPVDLHRGLVIHAPIGKAHPLLYGVSIGKGWDWVQLAMQTRQARSEAKAKGFAWLVNPDTAELAAHNVSRANSQQELAALWDRYHPQGLWTEEVNATAAARWEQIQAALNGQQEQMES